MHDNAFEALANEHRRTLLLDLLERNPQPANVEPSPEEGPQATKAEHRLQTEMNHTHLPKLVDYGFIEWDENTNDIIKGPQFGEIRPLLECIESSGME